MYVFKMNYLMGVITGTNGCFLSQQTFVPVALHLQAMPSEIFPIQVGRSYLGSHIIDISWVLLFCQM